MTGILQAILSFFGVQTTAANYIEDVFSTYLYTGTGSSQTITNSIDLSTKGGLVWIKGRSGATGHRLTDTVRGATKSLESNSTAAEATESTGLTAFGTTGFTIGADADYNTNAATYVSWTFREQAKFFDVVTYTGNGANRTIAHNLGSVPGSIFVKRTDTTGDWQVYHRANTANPETDYLVLNSTAATADSDTRWNDTAPTSAVFSLGTDATVNANSGTYVAYLFAHDAGGFGLSGTDNVISCGSWTGTGSTPGPVVTLGYEPQWVIWKRSDAGTEEWHIRDIMRGMPVSASGEDLYANDSRAAGNTTNEGLIPTATGFQVIGTNSNANTNGGTYIYITIRRGPMKTPTSGTSVFGLNARTGTGAIATVTGSTGVDDAVLIKNRGSAVGDLFAARLTGTGYLETSSDAAEVAAATTILQANPWDVMDGVKVGTTSTITNASANTFINYLFCRAPSFFDVVCYTGDGGNGTRTINHNLGVAPELIIIKTRSTSSTPWIVGSTPAAWTKYLVLNTTAATTTSDIFANTNPTSSVFSIRKGSGDVNESTRTFIAYLFATLAGISKVGSYTGTGTTQVINCGFTAGSRFVMIKRTDSTGDWYVWDSARGIVAGNDPYLLLNSTAAEVTNTDYVDTANSGFEISSTAPAAINANGGTFIFLAIA